MATKMEEAVMARKNEVEGLTKREWLAGMALQGALASGNLPHDAVETAINCSRWTLNDLGEFVSEDEVGNYEGLTKREWFAGMALQGALSSGKYLPHDAVEIAINCARLILDESN